MRDFAYWVLLGGCFVFLALWIPGVQADPLILFASPVHVDAGQNVTITLSQSLADGSPRLGNAANTWLYVYRGDGTLLINGVNPTELRYGAYRYAYTVPANSVSGPHIILARTVEPITGASRSTSNIVHVQEMTEPAAITLLPLILAASFTVLAVARPSLASNFLAAGSLGIAGAVVEQLIPPFRFALWGAALVFLVRATQPDSKSKNSYSR